MAGQPDRRRKSFPSWFYSWSSPSRASQRPRQELPRQPPLNASQSPEDQTASLKPPSPPPTQSPSPSHELSNGSRSSPPQEDKSTQPYKMMDLESSHAELLEGEVITEINEGKTKSVTESKQAETTEKERKKVEQSIEEETDKIAEESETVEGLEKNPNNEVHEHQKEKPEPKMSIAAPASKSNGYHTIKDDSFTDSKRNISTKKERKITVSKQAETVAEVLLAGEDGVMASEASVEQRIEEETDKTGKEPETVEGLEKNPNNEVHEHQKEKPEPKMSIAAPASKSNGYQTRKDDSFTDSKRHISTEKERKITVSKQAETTSVEQSIEEENDKIAKEAETVEGLEKNPNNEVHEHQKKKAEPKLSIAVSASKSNCYHTIKDDSFTDSERHISTEKERKITVSTMPKEGFSKLVQKLSIGHRNKPGDEESVSIITLASKNKGASMFVNTKKGKIIGKGSANASIATSINSNVQGINSSILNETNYSERNPGVHMTVSTMPMVTWGNRVKEESVTTQKAASMMEPPQKLAYEPRIRRRCLRGLLVEPSEDDMENSEKQRLHGCRFTCDDKKKAKGEGSK